MYICISHSKYGLHNTSFLGSEVLQIQNEFSGRRLTGSSSIVGLFVTYDIYYSYISPNYNVTLLKGYIFNNVTNTLNHSVHSGQFNRLLHSSNSTILSKLSASVTPTVYPPDIKVAKVTTHSPTYSPSNAIITPNTVSSSSTLISTTTIIIIASVVGFIVVACVLFFVFKYISDEKRKNKYFTFLMKKNEGITWRGSNDTNVDLANTYYNIYKTADPDPVDSQSKAVITPAFDNVSIKNKRTRSKNNKLNKSSNVFDGGDDNDIESNGNSPLEVGSFNDKKSKLKRPKSNKNIRDRNGAIDGSKDDTLISGNITYETNPGYKSQTLSSESSKKKKKSKKSLNNDYEK